MSDKAHVTSDTLQAMIDGLQACSSSVASLRGELKAYIQDCLHQARTIVARLKAIEAAANMEFKRCESAYYSCRDRQRYDEERHEYRPSCSCEERDMRNAKDKLYKAQSNREQAEMRLQDMERLATDDERGGGAQANMGFITDQHVPEATKRLFALKDKVDRYETLEITGIDIGDPSSSTPKLSDPQPKAVSFRNGSEKLRELMRQKEAERQSQPKVCPGCGKIPCECARIRELFRLRMLGNER